MLRQFKRLLRRVFRVRNVSYRRSHKPILMIERRRFSRVPSRNLIRILSRDQLQLDHIFNIADFSEAGLRIRTDLDAHPGSLIDAVINLRERNRHLAVKLRVVWTQKSRRGYAWGGQMGAEMMNLSAESKNMLRLLVLEKQGRLRAA